MKKLMTVLLCVIFAISVIYHPVTALAVNGEHDCGPNADIVSSDVIDETVPPEEEIPCVPISEIDLDDDLAFLADYDVSIPDCYVGNAALNELIRKTVVYARANDYYAPAYNFTVLAFMADQIANATAKHDGVDTELLHSDSGEPTRYTLVNSTKYGKWKTYYETTNCYGYALGKKIRQNPGFYDGDFTYNELVTCLQTGNIKSIADTFASDLRKLGYTVRYSTNIPSSGTLSNANNVVICLRICEDDYHFMRYNQTAKGWVHKPSTFHVLKYKHQMAGTTEWSNERITSSGVVEPPDCYYDSSVYYFICTPHKHISEEVTGTGDASAHTCLCILCGKDFYQAHSPNASGSACIVCGRKPPFTSLKFVGGEGFEAALPQTNHDAFLRKFYHDNNNQ